MQTLIIILIWLIGFAISYLMLRTEIAAEKQPFTTGDRILSISLSLLSFAWVVVILITAWVKQIGKGGYWNEPVKKEKDIIVVADKPKDQKRSLNRVNSNDN